MAKFFTKKEDLFEWAGVSTAIIYSLTVAMNIGAEFIGFFLLLLSSFLIGIWSYLGNTKGYFLVNYSKQLLES